ncbi:MAG: hypothetical protein KDD45_16570 [Bdellovibrionales bacterium]|nr:hypothetical protein [Bdellovibrionales bacterium]
MAWIADQKPLGKFLGTITGTFVAATWGHFHHRIFRSIGLKCNKLYFQLFVVGVTASIFRPSSLLEIISPAAKGSEPTSWWPITFTSTTIFSSVTFASLRPCDITQRQLLGLEQEVH